MSILDGEPWAASTSAFVDPSVNDGGPPRAAMLTSVPADWGGLIGGGGSFGVFALGSGSEWRDGVSYDEYNEVLSFCRSS